jgi:hypothetical protein
MNEKIFLFVIVALFDSCVPNKILMYLQNYTIKLETIDVIQDALKPYLVQISAFSSIDKDGYAKNDILSRVDKKNERCDLDTIRVSFDGFKNKSKYAYGVYSVGFHVEIIPTKSGLSKLNKNT